MAFHRSSKITENPISPLRTFNGSESGAVIDFSGVVRGTEAGRPIKGILYSCYRDMAERTLNEIVENGAIKFNEDHGVEIIHRIGFVAAGDASLLIQVYSPHSPLALESLAFYLAEVKRLAPVWKEPQFMEHNE